MICDKSKQVPSICLFFSAYVCFKAEDKLLLSNGFHNLCNLRPLFVCISFVCRNKAILFYFNMLKCASPAVLINLQCPTTQVWGWRQPCLEETFTLLNIFFSNFSPKPIERCVLPLSSASPSALTDLPHCWKFQVPTTGDITSNSASLVLWLAVR